MSSLPKFTIKELMDAGTHFGHKTMRWNPKMQPFIYGARNNIHIIDLQKTAPLLHSALKVINEVAAKNGRILFVATKRQASQILAEAAERCGQYYVNYRWMGGMLTNWGTVSKSIKTLNNLEKQLEDPEMNFNKKEKLQIQRKIEKLQKALGGIRRMGGKPDLIVVLDTRREKIAIQEAKKLEIPIVAVVDTNSDPDDVDYIVPGNDDSIKSIRLFCNLFADAALSGIQQSVGGFEAKKAGNDDAKSQAKKEEEKAEKGKSEAKTTKAKAEVKVEKKAAKKVEPKKDEKAKTSEQEIKEEEKKAS